MTLKFREQDMNGRVEQSILTGMIVEDSVIARIAGKWTEGGLFESRHANVIGSWCVKFYNKYGKAPGRSIESLFASWATNHTSDAETVRTIEKVLGGLSNNYAKARKRINPDLLVDTARDHFNTVRATKLAEAIQGDVQHGKPQDAIDRAEKFKRIEIGSDATVDVLQDINEMWSAIEDRKKSVLFKYPGALGKFFGSSLELDGFLAFLGPEKRGKTYWLLDLAYRAMLSRKRVAFFEVGDLTKKQILRRFAARILKRPVGPTSPDRPVKVPESIQLLDEGHAVKVYFRDPKEYKDWVTRKDVIKACDKVTSDRVKSKEPYLKLSTHPNSSISVNGIRAVIQDWAAAGWTPEVVVIDYADILAAPPGFQGESRDAINETWKAMRRMSQELHCLVVTATQANAASYTAESLSMSNFSEDKRKFAHVTGMVGINQSSTEKSDGVQRLNWLVLREDEFLTSKFVHAAGCLAISNPAVISV